MKLGDLNSFLRSYDMVSTWIYLIYWPIKTFFELINFLFVFLCKQQSDGSILRKNSDLLPFHYHLKNTANAIIEEPKPHFEDSLTVTTNETYQLPEQNDEDDAKESDHLIARNGLPRMSIMEKKQSIDENKNFETQSNISSESIAEDLKCLDINDLFNISIQVANGMKVGISLILSDV